MSILYSADEGAVFDMEMIDGILYFTTWKYHDGFKLNQYQLDCTLYSYDLRWRRLRVLLSYEGDAEHDNSTLHILNNKNKEKEGQARERCYGSCFWFVLFCDFLKTVKNIEK